MGKRLNIESKFTIDGFKVKVGTTNRLSPTTVYIDLGGYIVPEENKTNYETNINLLDKDFKKNLKKMILDKKIYEKKYICVIETAHERMKVGKNSYISLQCHLKQNSNLNTDVIINETEKLTKEFMNNFIKTLSDYGFSTKK